MNEVGEISGSEYQMVVVRQILTNIIKYYIQNEMSPVFGWLACGGVCMTVKLQKRGSYGWYCPLTLHSEDNGPTTSQ
jgi:hypothetical protein